MHTPSHLASQLRENLLWAGAAARPYNFVVRNAA